MSTLLFLLVFGALGTLYFFLGIRASRNVKSDLDYFIANRQLGTWQISCNLIATQLGGGMLLGTAAAAYTSGYYGLLYTVGMALGFLLLSSGIAARLQQFQVTTTAQLFETQYHSPFLKKIASGLSIMTLFGILIAQVVGFKSLMTSIGFGSGLITLPFWLSVIAYTMVGGLRAITINDMVQLGIITSTFGGIFIYMFFTRATMFASFTQQQALFTPELFSFSTIFGLIFMPALFSLIEQDLAQRFFASKSKKVAIVSAFNAALFLLLFAIIPVYLGMQAKLLGIIIPQGTNPLLIFLQRMLPDTIFALALCAIIAAIISTADALMNGISANITQDFNIGQYGFGTRLTISKVTTLIVGLAALIASYFVPQDVIAILIGSYELSVSCLLIPLLFCYFRKTVYKNAAFLSIGAGFIGFFVFRLYPVALPKELLALVFSFIGYVIGNKMK